MGFPLAFSFSKLIINPVTFILRQRPLKITVHRVTFSREATRAWKRAPEMPEITADFTDRADKNPS